MKPLRFYFDFISPFAYLAWARLAEIEHRARVRFERVPVLFAAILDQHGQLGPAEIPAKKRWVFRHVARVAARHGIPLNPPAHHPFNPLLPLRLASLDLEDADRDALIDALFRGIWVERLHVAEQGPASGLLTLQGLDTLSMLAASSEPAIKERLKAQTAHAIEAGVFGVPSFQVGDEIFWGFDDIPQLLDVLDGLDTLDPEWESALPQPSATRRHH